MDYQRRLNRLRILNMPRIPETKDEIIDQAILIASEAVPSQENALRMAVLFLDVLIDIRDNLNIPTIIDGDISE